MLRGGDTAGKSRQSRCKVGLDARNFLKGLGTGALRIDSGFRCEDADVVRSLPPELGVSIHRSSILSSHKNLTIVEGSLEAKLPTIWTDGDAQPGRNSDVEKVRREKIRDGEDKRSRRSEMEKVRRVKMQVE